MASGIKIRATVKDGITEVKALMRHEMEPGTRRDADTGELIPAHYIQEVVVEHDGKVVMRADWGPAVSRNPYLSFKFKGGRPGDTIRITWTDNLGRTESAEDTIQ